MRGRKGGYEVSRQENMMIQNKEDFTMEQGTSLNFCIYFKIRGNEIF